MVNGLMADEPAVEGLIEALEATPPVTGVRLNKRKTDCQPVAIADAEIEEQVPWCREGYVLRSRPAFTFDPAIHQGLYYVQDPSSMFISHVIGSLGLDRPVVYLDACAAPGGKTTAAIDALPAGSLVVANEWDYRRAEILKENLMKWGYPGVVVSRGDTSRFRKLTETFDIIAADVPCSGEGMMRKDAEAVAQWSERLVEQCAERQREIIDNLWPSLKPGGYLVYSTCTFNRAENEEMLDYIVTEYGALPVEIPTDGMPEILSGIDTPYPCYRFMPHRVKGEGLFMAVLRKPGQEDTGKTAKLKEPKTPRLQFSLPAWFPAGLVPRLDGDTLYGLPARHVALIDRLTQKLDTILQGIEVATVKGRDLIPSQGLAMYDLFTGEGVAKVDVTQESALAFLRREAIELPEGTPRGFVLVTYHDSPLGWVKNIGNRSNNLYPAHWRILRKGDK